MGLTGMLSRTFLLAGSRLECHGLDEFLGFLDEREDVDRRTKGLITGTNYACNVDLANSSLPTVSNHLSVYVCDANAA